MINYECTAAHVDEGSMNERRTQSDAHNTKQFIYIFFGFAAMFWLVNNFGVTKYTRQVRFKSFYDQLNILGFIWYWG